MKSESDSVSQQPRREDPQMPINVAEPTRRQGLASLRRSRPGGPTRTPSWMRDIILGRKTGSARTVVAGRQEKRMVETCERRILEFPLGMDAREVAKELKREGWYAWAPDYRSIVTRIERVRAKAETEERVWLIPIALSGRRRSYYQKTRVIHSPFPSARY